MSRRILNVVAVTALLSCTDREIPPEQPNVAELCAQWCQTVRACDAALAEDLSDAGTCEAACEGDAGWDDIPCSKVVVEIAACVSELPCAEYSRLGAERYFEDEPCWLSRAVHVRECVPPRSILNDKRPRYW
jgi:hypothetical protein